MSIQFKKFPESLFSVRYQRSWFSVRAWIVTFFIIAVMVGLVFFSTLNAPKEFPVGQIITIPQDSTKGEIATLLKHQNVIRSRTVFYIITRWVQGNQPLLAGDYQFERKKGLFMVIRTVTQGIFGNVTKRVTLFEGSTIREMAETLQGNIPAFDKETFLINAEGREGYLFPDTYLFFKSVTPETVLEILSDQYEKQVDPLREKIAQLEKTEEEIIIMASLLEKEAYSGIDAKVISGILWKRLKIGMPLQVDAPFLYVLGKTSAQLSRADLQEDGPYNTYTRTGFPMGPIANPGLTMIEAALNPIESPYLFYLHDSMGNVYYARTHAEHVANKQAYLR